MCASSKTLVANDHNYFLNFLKGISSICVILVHFPILGAVGKCLASIGLCGVILFFLISGFYSYGKHTEYDSIKRRFKKNVRQLLIVVGLHIVFTLVLHLLDGTIETFFLEMLSVKLWLRYLFIGDFALFHCYQLWFLLALIYGYVFFWFFTKYRMWKFLYSLLPFLLLLRIVVETYVNTFGADIAPAANVFVGALPIMVLGHFLAYQKEAIQKLPIRHLFFFCLFNLVFTFISVAFEWKVDFSQIGKIGTAVSFFMLAQRKPLLRPCRLLERIGRDLSIYTYFFHVAVGAAITLIFKKFGLAEGYSHYLLPVCTVIFTCLLAWCIKYFTKYRIRLRDA